MLYWTRFYQTYIFSLDNKLKMDTKVSFPPLFQFLASEPRSTKETKQMKKKWNPSSEWKSKVSAKMREEEIKKLRGVVCDCVSKQFYSSATFFADRVAAFTADKVAAFTADIYMQAQALFLAKS